MVKPFMEYDENGNETTNIDFSFEYEGKTVLMQVAYEINFLNEKREIQNLLDIEWISRETIQNVLFIKTTC